MPREVRLKRRITASGPGWAGDGAAWTEASPPAPATVNAAEVGHPVFEIPIKVRENEDLLTRGAAGFIRVTGADATRRFDLQVFVEWLRVDVDKTKTSDWRLLTGSVARNVGDGDDFTTDPVELRDQRIAFHLTPVGGDLAAGSTVEIWVTEI